MKKLLILLLSLPIFSMSQSIGDGYTIASDNINSTTEVSDVATMSPEYKKYKKRGVKMLVGGICTMAAGAGIYYYSTNHMKGYTNQSSYRLTGVAIFSGGATITILSTIPFTKSKRIKNKDI